jgi:hypothetical protein
VVDPGPDFARDGAVALLRLRRDDRHQRGAPLLGGEVAAAEVLADDEGARVVVIAIELIEQQGVIEPDSGIRLHRNPGGVIAIPPIEDLPLIDRDWLVLAVPLDVLDQGVELLALHQREDVGERMKLERGVGGHDDALRRSEASSRLARASSLARLAHHLPPIFVAGIAPRSRSQNT